MLRAVLCALIAITLSAPNFVCEADKANFEYMTAWCASSEANRLKTEHALVSHDAVFHPFLSAFVAHGEVAALLAARPHFDYGGKSIQDRLPEPKEGEEDEYKEERDAREKSKKESEAIYHAWFEALQTVLTKFSARIMHNPHHECPTALVIRFDAFPQYVVKMRARNGYRLGFYDAEGRLSCAVPGTKISEYEYPIQLVARVLYAEKIKAFLAAHNITNIQIPNKYLFIFPGYEDKPLDDANLFVVADFVPFKPEYQDGFFELVCAAYASYKASETHDLTDPLQSMLANLFKVTQGCALWDFTEGAGNFVFTFNAAGQPTVVFLDTERPAFGGGNPLYFFHQNKEEMVSNASVGMRQLIEMLTVQPAEDEETTPDAGEEKFTLPGEKSA